VTKVACDLRQFAILSCEVDRWSGLSLEDRHAEAEEFSISAPGA
jgi:hypothetical protein